MQTWLNQTLKCRFWVQGKKWYKFNREDKWIFKKKSIFLWVVWLGYTKLNDRRLREDMIDEELEKVKLIRYQLSRSVDQSSDRTQRLLLAATAPQYHPTVISSSILFAWMSQQEVKTNQII